MAFYFDPAGRVIPRPERFGLDEGARIMRGTASSDTFVFSDATSDKVVVGMGGGDTFNAAATMTEWDTRYYSWLDYNHHQLLFPSVKWEPWKSGKDIAHIGGNMDAKLGYGADKIVLHGGHYQNPAQVWVQPDDKVYMAGSAEKITGWKIGKIIPDSDGKGYTANLFKVSLEGSTKNPITDGQKLDLMFQDQGTYFDRPGHNVFEQARVDFNRAAGPTAADVMDFITGHQADSAAWDIFF